ncbi:hypothetical protein [Pseudoclavibacter endophyticus]|uniref:Uncharacterized protein n=1 Tax=Pseudoclavibacter endophyticus TaxID=1778590 RepID=A0A6H9WN38_9MICO|nr:hypothetical protein [Pseudoclavibacter endophyticus]KAB1650296.1 hypothetical protein F8O04_08925 [Pseudoclavibacter endophyticus]
MSSSNGGWDFSEYSSPPSGAGGGSGLGGRGDAQDAFGSSSPFGGPSPFGGQAAPTGGQSGPFGEQTAAPYDGQAGPVGRQGGGAAFGAGRDLFGNSSMGAGNDLFGSASSLGGAPAPLEPVAAPTGWLFAAVALALVSGVVASVFGGIPLVAIICWALAGPVVIGLFAVYLMRDVRARAHLTYSPPTWGPMLYAAGLVVTFAAVVIASLQIAFWVGRM